MPVQFGAIVMIPRVTEAGQPLTEARRKQFGELVEREFYAMRRSGHGMIDSGVETYQGDVFFVTDAGDRQTLKFFNHLLTLWGNLKKTEEVGLVRKMKDSLFATARQAADVGDEAGLWGRAHGGGSCPVLPK